MKQETLLAYLTDQLDGIKGKKAAQKLTYFCSEAGVPLSAAFRMHIFGPYSVEVSDDLGQAVFKEILSYNKDGRTFNLGNEGKAYLQENSENIKKHKEKIDRVIASFGTMKPMELELYSTVHFIATAFKEFKKDLTEEMVVNEVIKAKGNKFDRKQVHKAFENLVNWGWLNLEKG